MIFLFSSVSATLSVNFNFFNLCLAALLFLSFHMCNTPQCWVGYSRIITVLRMSLMLIETISSTSSGSKSSDIAANIFWK